MGRAKDAMLQALEDEHWEERQAYIRERLGDPNADESTDGWARYSEEFDLENDLAFELDHADTDNWMVAGRGRHELFVANIEAALEILGADLMGRHLKTRLVMLHAHVVASLEAYLFTTFLHHALASQRYMLLLIEHDDKLASQKFGLKEIFSKPDWFKRHLSSHLKSLVFHNIGKVAPLYEKVLGVSFGDIGWLASAVALRHDCVHRAGFDPDGNEVNLTNESIGQLINEALTFVHRTERAVLDLVHDDDDKGDF